MLISFILIYFQARNISAPIKDINKAVNYIASGKFDKRVKISSPDEVGQLASSFNYMAEALSRQNDMHNAFISDVSHELRTPMTSISGFVGGILDGTIPPEKQKDYLQLVYDETTRLAKMTSDMLEMSKMSSSEYKLDVTDFDINELVCRTVFAFEQKIEEKKLEIMGLESDEVFVKADNDLIHQVVYNLIDNAVKFVNEGGCISFSYEQKDGKVFVSVRNTGAGIAQQELPRLFDRFYKTDKSRGLDKTGVGLGLYIVQTIVNQHKGDLIVKSVEGEYTEFTVSLPASDTKALKERAKRRSSEEKEK
jgi:signal transduction histidine kinase